MTTKRGQSADVHLVANKAPKISVFWAAAVQQPKRKFLTLAGFEAPVGFVNHVEAATTAHNTVIAMPAAQ